MQPELQVGIAEMNIRTGRAVLDENPKYLSKFLTFVTVYEKTRHMGFFVKIKFDAYLISSTLELTYLQV